MFKPNKRTLTLLALLLAAGSTTVTAQNKAKPEDTEVWEPVPKVVMPAKLVKSDPPADAIILFNGNNLDQWVSTNDRSKPAEWTVKGDIMTVDKSKGNIETKQSFGNYQLHIEWRIPKNITGTGQNRGNSGVFLASLGSGDLGYELQVVDSYENKTYVNGMAGSIYKQFIPLANPARKPGEWQTYDIAWTAPTFNTDGSVKTKARVTVLFNGVVVQNNTELNGPTRYIGKASYEKAHGPSPIKLQSHGDKSEPISFRNIWVREL